MINNSLFPVLEAQDIECRVQRITDKGASLLLYKTARTDARMLDQVVGAFGWQSDYRMIGDTLYCGIGILDPEGEKWIWKWDCGAETQVEAEKGQASDAFKRAGFKWGIGRELYTAPFIWVGADKMNIVDGKRTFDTFTVVDIDYQDGEISRLVIRNDKNGRIVCDWTKNPQTASKQAKKAISEDDRPASTLERNLMDRLDAEIRVDTPPPPADQKVSTEHRRELIRLSMVRWGAEAQTEFKRVTGYNSTADVPEEKYSEVYKVLTEGQTV